MTGETILILLCSVQLNLFTRMSAIILSRMSNPIYRTMMFNMLGLSENTALLLSASTKSNKMRNDKPYSNFSPVSVDNIIIDLPMLQSSVMTRADSCTGG